MVKSNHPGMVRTMTIYELNAPGQRVEAFEVDNLTLVWRPLLRRVLESAPGVSDVQVGSRYFGDEHRAHFRYHGVAFVVWEPFGDNSRYWIGPEDQAGEVPDLTGLMDAFRAFGPPQFFV